MDEYPDLNFKALKIHSIIDSGVLSPLRSGDNVKAKRYMAVLKECYADFIHHRHHLKHFGGFERLRGAGAEHILHCICGIHVCIIQELACRFIEKDILSVGG
jgi:hypothetical protein